MKWRTVLVAIVVVCAAVVCVRLGFWQLARWDQKRARNAEMRAALAAPAVAIADSLPPPAAVVGRRVEARGRLDSRRQVVLAGREHEGVPGVGVVTPLVLADGAGAVLVDRGWIPAVDGATAHPQEYPEPGDLAVSGVAVEIPRGAGGPSWRAFEDDSVTLWSALGLDLDSLEARLPYPVAPWVLRALPDARAPALPRRAAPRPLDETLHLSYAAQWFLFAAALLVVPPLLARRRHAPAAGRAANTGRGSGAAG